MKKIWIISLPIVTLLAVLAGYLLTNYTPAQDTEAEPVKTELIPVDSEYKLLFFGYAGCYHFCDPRLRLIDPIYEKIKKDMDVTMLMVDISEETTLEEAEGFVKDVNPEFGAINPVKADIEALQKMFEDVYIKKMPDGEYWHSGFLYLLKRSGDTYGIIKIYVEFTQSDAVAADIKKITGK